MRGLTHILDDAGAKKVPLWILCSSPLAFALFIIPSHILQHRQQQQHPCKHSCKQATRLLHSFILSLSFLLYFLQIFIIMCDCPGMILGLSIVAALLFIPLLMALWYCRRDILPAWCVAIEDKHNAKHANKGRGKLDLPSGGADFKMPDSMERDARDAEAGATTDAPRKTRR
jgi:hypothetical protein